MKDSIGIKETEDILQDSLFSVNLYSNHPDFINIHWSQWWQQYQTFLFGNKSFAFSPEKWHLLFEEKSRDSNPQDPKVAHLE